MILLRDRTNRNPSAREVAFRDTMDGHVFGVLDPLLLLRLQLLLKLAFSLLLESTAVCDGLPKLFKLFGAFWRAIAFFSDARMAWRILLCFWAYLIW